MTVLVTRQRAWRRASRLAAITENRHDVVRRVVLADAAAALRRVVPTMLGPSLRLGRRVWLAAVDWRARLAARKRARRGWR